MARAILNLSPEATAIVNDYVASILAECLGEGEAWPLATAWREAEGPAERSYIAAALVCRANALADAPYRILDERGDLADRRLCAVADALGIA